MSKFLVLCSIAIFALIFIYPVKVQGAKSDKYNVVLIQSSKDIYCTAEINLYDLKVNFDLFEPSMAFHKKFISTAKVGNFDNIKKLFVNEDESQATFELYRNKFDRFNFYKTLDKSFYSFGISWGSYRLLSVDYTVKGEVRNAREDFFCEPHNLCRKSMRDFGQPFEIAYERLLGQLKVADQGERQVSSKLDQIKSFLLSPPGYTKPIEKNPIIITIGVKQFKSKVCINCDPKKSRILQSEAFALEVPIKFVRGLSGLDITNYNSMVSYIKKHDKDYKENIAFPVTNWNKESVKTVYSDIVGYVTRIRRWQGELLGYIESNEGIYIFIRLDDGSVKENFDMEILFLEKVSVNKYVFRPTRKQNSLEQTLISDSFFLESLRKIFI